ncbi:MAG: flagellar biosynthesis protein FlhA [Pseudomonadota bacterium]
MMPDLRSLNVAVPILLLALLALMTLRVPAFVLDVAFTFNIALAIIVLLVAVYALRPLEFAAFPTILLVATLLRLALNVASTRVVLLEGHNGGAAAGYVIQSFGEVVVGGNYVVGLVVFVILVIINFVVVTKGAGRISEVSARFTLDAMPGKQMAIDADLNAGLIDQDQARTRREEVAQEADFYGSMDGASKFVRGDAVAGILILIINIVGGLIIGMAQHGLDFSAALERYTLLTIGDGLVAQIPSLLLSTAAAMIVTRVNGEADVSDQVVDQMFTDPRALSVSAGILAVLGLVPGMPHLVFLSLAAVCGFGAHLIARQPARRAADSAATEAEQGAEEATSELGWQDIQPVDALGLEVGFRLIPLVDEQQDGVLLNRIRAVRKKLSQEFGFLVPTVHIRDNLDLLATSYRIALHGVTVAEADIHPDRMLAIDPGEVFGRVEGIETVDPAYGLNAVWIEESERDNAQTLGYTVVDASTVVATHLNQVMLDNAAELLGHDEVQQLMDKLAAESPRLVEQLLPEPFSIAELHRIMRLLLTEKVPLRDVRSIAAALLDASADGRDPERLLMAVRRALGRQIVHSICGNDPQLEVVTLDAELESLLLKAKASDDPAPALEPGMADRLQKSFVEVADQREVAGKPTIVLVSGAIRQQLARFVRFTQRAIHVLAFEEVPDGKQIAVISTIGRSSP